MKKHFVTFYSPGTFFSEETTKPIDSWDVDQAVKMADSITERYAATPYAFQFSTRERKHDELDSREVKRSCAYHLGGEVLTLQQVKARNDPKDSVLISNMRCNGWHKIVENRNSWKHVEIFNKGDVLLSYTPKRKAVKKAVA